MGLMNLMLESGAFNILFWIIIVLIVIGLAGWGIYAYIKKKYMYVYNFHLISHDGALEHKKARIVTGANKVRKFELEHYKGQLLEIRDPNAWVNKRPTRLISFDGQGNLVYCENVEEANLNENDRFKVSKTKYLETALKPVERETIANNIIDAVRMFGKVPNELKLVFWFAVALILIIVIGMFVQGRLLAEQYSKNAGAIDEMRKTSDNLVLTAKMIKENTEMQKILWYYMTGNKTNITFETITIE